MESWFLDARNCKFGSSLEFILGGAVLVERSFIISIFEQFPGNGKCRLNLQQCTKLFDTTSNNTGVVGYELQLKPLKCNAGKNLPDQSIP